MITFYEVKKIVCRLFGYRDIELNDDDIVIKIKSGTSVGINEFILRDAELKEVYNRVCENESEGLELCDGNKYELAVDIDYPVLKRDEFPIISRDEENKITYELGYATVDYCIFLLKLYIEMKKQNSNNRVILPIKWRRPIEYRIRIDDSEELDWKNALIHAMGEFSIKITSDTKKMIETFRNRKTAYIFEFVYKSEINLYEYVNIDDVFPQRVMMRERVDITSLENVPHREYISDVVDYYKLAFASSDPYIKYISFYHIMEYFYDEAFKKKLVEALRDKITNPDFSYKNDDKVYEIALFVKNRMHRNDESGQGDELESLKYVLKEYVNIDELKNKLMDIDGGLVSYYQSNKVSFSKAPAIAWNDVEGVYTQMAKRIYFTRNALIHSKSGKNSERYKPYKDEKQLKKEIALVKIVAEMIIINSSTII